jgi:hypothetical protein
MIPLFGFPVYIANINEQLFEKNQIISDIEHNYNLNKNRNLWDNESNLHHSYNDENNDLYKKINYDSLIPLYDNEIKKYVDNFKYKEKIIYKFSVVNYTCTTKSQYMKSHYHNDSDFTAVHYLKYNQNYHKPTFFENTNSYINFLPYLRPNLKNLLDTTDLKNSWISKNYHFDVKENDMIISPSFLFHNVPAQSETDETRITIVLNITIDKY